MYYHSDRYVAPPRQSQLYKYKHDFCRKIACGMQMRGDFDDVPTLIYYGAPFQLIKDVMEMIGKAMSEAMEGYVIRREHSCRYKNGKAFRRVSVEIHGLDSGFLPVTELFLTINNLIEKKCWCEVKEMSLRKLLNL